jgi:hypothetical protein
MECFWPMGQIALILPGWSGDFFVCNAPAQHNFAVRDEARRPDRVAARSHAFLRAIDL